MRICTLSRVIAQHNVKGGMEIHADILSRGLVERSHDVTIITTAHPNGLEYEEVEGIKIYYLKNSKAGCYSRQWWKESIKKFLIGNVI